MYILNKGKGFINSLSQLYTIDWAKRDTEMRFGKRGQDGGGAGGMSLDRPSISFILMIIQLFAAM